jgi:hypothetical protein
MDHLCVLSLLPHFFQKEFISPHAWRRTLGTSYHPRQLKLLNKCVGAGTSCHTKPRTQGSDRYEGMCLPVVRHRSDDLNAPVASRRCPIALRVRSRWVKDSKSLKSLPCLLQLVLRLVTTVLLSTLMSRKEASLSTTRCGQAD